jgi:hypothetical protein
MPEKWTQIHTDSCRELSMASAELHAADMRASFLGRNSRRHGVKTLAVLSNTGISNAIHIVFLFDPGIVTRIIICEI